MTTRSRSSIDRLMTVAMGYAGVVTFVLVFYISLVATRAVPGDLVVEHATSAPLWIWTSAISAAGVASHLIGLLRRAVVNRDRPATSPPPPTATQE